MNQQHHTNIQGRHLIRQADEISARHDSPNGGLRAIREKNMRDPTTTQIPAQRQEAPAT